MKETQMQTFFKKHLLKHPPTVSEVYELKICKTTSLPFEAVKDHQIKALQEASTGLFHKITDPPIYYGGETRFNIPRPFDCFYIRDVLGYVVLWFYKPREKKIFIKIPIGVFLKEKETATRKSLTEERAKQLGEEIVIDIKE